MSQNIFQNTSQKTSPKAPSISSKLNQTKSIKPATKSTFQPRHWPGRITVNRTKKQKVRNKGVIVNQGLSIQGVTDQGVSIQGGSIQGVSNQGVM